ncbi:MAG: GHKL domain-containing protein [Firmicutes bacterium]|nr:GHKL domain-containing protein [Bacillota bacterium]
MFKYERYIKRTFVLIIFFIFINVNTVFAKDNNLILQLRWNHQFQFAGYYVAKWQGFYEKEGLNVEIKSGFTKDGEVLSATEEVSKERADFGIGAVDILINQNNNNRFSVVSSVFQRSAVEYFMLEDTKYNSIVDFTKLKTARRKNDLLDIELKAMLKSEGIKPDNSNYLDQNVEFSVNDLVKGKYDVIPGYLGTISFYAEKKGIDLNVIKPVEYGIDFYGDSLFTRRDFALENPELVEKFRKASMRGWAYALEHPIEVSKEISKRFDIKNKSYNEFLEYNKYQAQKISDLTFYPVVEIGNMNPYRWEKMHAILKQLNLVNGNLDLENFLFDYQEIVNKKTNRFVKGIIFFSIITLIITIIFFLFNLTKRNKKLKKEIQERKQVEKMYKHELRENKRKEALIIYQARMAAMGEMIANIAHQWRQPLNSLGLILENIKDAYNFNELDSNYLHNSLDKSRNLIDKMSETIDDFRYFLNPNNNKEKFIVYEKVKSVLDLIEEKIKYNNIKIIYENIDMVKGYGYPNQYSQAIFNILNNSIDALKGEENKEIKISIYKSKDMIVTEIIDNGEGISEDIKEKIFKMYFTTKKASKGTGLGLYMTKKIIENMDGLISFKNLNKGLLMKVEIPKYRGDLDGNR